LIQKIDSNVTNVSTGAFHFIFSKESKLYGYGISNDAQLGRIDHETRDIKIPILIEGMNHAKLLCCGAYYSIVHLNDTIGGK
jgi:alpha-tubulin suppressor-like RCC1 family protein